MYTNLQLLSFVSTTYLILQHNKLRNPSGVCCPIRRLLGCAVSPLNTWSIFLGTVQVSWSCKDMNCMHGVFVIRVIKMLEPHLVHDQLTLLKKFQNVSEQRGWMAIPLVGKFQPFFERTFITTAVIGWMSQMQQ